MSPHDILEASHLFERITLQPLSVGYYPKYKILVEFNRDKDEDKRLFNAKDRVFVKIRSAIQYKTDEKDRLHLKVNYDRLYRSVVKRLNTASNDEDVPPETRKFRWIMFLHEDYLHFTWHSLIVHMRGNGSTEEEILELKKEIESVEVENNEERSYYEKLLERLIREVGNRLEYNRKGENVFFQAYQVLISLLHNIPSEFFHDYLIEIAISDEELDAISELLKTLDSEYLKKDFPDFLKRILSVDFYPFSSGEEAYLDLFATLYQGVTFDTEHDKKTLLILLDEPDRFMHPEWCRLFFSAFKQFLERISGGYRDYQIVFTTHSPFLISDLPNSHVITLKKNPHSGNCMVIRDSLQTQTFASNIHTVLADNFFLDSTMGELAIQSINHVIKRLSSRRSLKEKERQRIVALIEQIGEPIVQAQLIEMYNAKVPQDREERRRMLLEQQRKIQLELQSLEHGEDV
ncbi:AAA family ATPase [Neobacillus drentensis]|uniref:AAA family ATPase n=1 Tax=Neobacillus drentensis TaxID=220684 RepID=UPI002FFFE77B